MLQRAGAAGVLQHGQQTLLHVWRGHGVHRFVAPQVVQKKLSQPLAIKMADSRAAVIELVRHAPGAFGCFVRPAEVRVAQAILAQILARPAQHHHPRARARMFCIQRSGGLLGQLHATLQ